MAEAAGTAIELLKSLIGEIKNKVEQYKSAEEKAKRLQITCEVIEKLLQPFNGADDLPVKVVIDHLEKINKDMEKLLEDYIVSTKSYNSKTSYIRKSYYRIKYTMTTLKFSQQFSDYADQISDLLNELQTVLELSFKILEPSPLRYQKEMEKKHMDFWIEICGNRIHNDKVSWPLFITLYQQKNSEQKLDLELKTRIKAVALVENDALTFYGYMQLTKLCGLPIDEKKLPQLLDCNSSMSASDLIKVSELVDNLIRDFSTKEMNNYLVAIMDWFKNPNKNKYLKQTEIKDDQSLTDKEREKEKEKKKLDIQKRADECYNIIEKLRKKGKTKESCEGEEKEALIVDEARRHISLFYQRFMAICEIGQLSRQIFKKVDFPGKARMYDFINYCQPLDKANFYIIIKSDKEWEDKKPKVYKFLVRYIDEITEEPSKQKNKNQDVNNSEQDKPQR